MSQIADAGEFEIVRQSLQDESREFSEERGDEERGGSGRMTSMKSTGWQPGHLQSNEEG